MTPLVYLQRQLLDLPCAARTLVAQSRRGVLGTLDRHSQGPYTSLIELAPVNEQGQVLLLLSTLADHTQNLIADGRASVLCSPAWDDPEPLASARVSLLGTLSRCEPDETLSQVYLEAHPQAASYIHFKDFALYLLHVERARFIAGFGRMDWLDAQTYACASPDPLGASAAGIIAHMNEDHELNMIQYAQAFGQLSWAEHAQMVEVDSQGMTIWVTGQGQHQRLGLGFGERATHAGQVRKHLVRMANEAREILGL